MFFTKPRMTSAPRASTCAVSDWFLGRCPLVLGLVARYMRLKLSNVMVNGDRGALVVLCSATMLRQHVVLVTLVASVVVSMSHPRPPDRSQHGCTVGVDRDPPV